MECHICQKVARRPHETFQKVTERISESSTFAKFLIQLPRTFIKCGIVPVNKLHDFTLSLEMHKIIKLNRHANITTLSHRNDNYTRDMRKTFWDVINLLLISPIYYFPTLLLCIFIIWQLSILMSPFDDATEGSYVMLAYWEVTCETHESGHMSDYHRDIRAFQVQRLSYLPPFIPASLSILPMKFLLLRFWCEQHEDQLRHRFVAKP